MRDFTAEDWKEVCKRIRENNLAAYSLMSCYSDSNVEPVNEMSVLLKQFKKDVISIRSHLYDTICNICCLEDVFPYNVEHWTNELKEAFNVLIDPELKNNMKKDKVIISELIEPMISSKTFEPESDRLFINAMELEISKANKPNAYNKERKQKEVKIIEELILPNITVYRIANTKRFATLMKKAAKAIIEDKRVQLYDAIDEFVNTKVDISI